MRREYSECACVQDTGHASRLRAHSGYSGRRSRVMILSWIRAHSGYSGRKKRPEYPERTRVQDKIRTRLRRPEYPERSRNQDAALRHALTRIQDTWSGNRARIQNAAVRMQNPEKSLQIPGFDNPGVRGKLEEWGEFGTSGKMAGT